MTRIYSKDYPRWDSDTAQGRVWLTQMRSNVRHEGRPFLLEMQKGPYWLTEGPFGVALSHEDLREFIDAAHELLECVPEPKPAPMLAPADVNLLRDTSGDLWGRAGDDAWTFPADEAGKCHDDSWFTDQTYASLIARYGVMEPVADPTPTPKLPEGAKSVIDRDGDTWDLEGDDNWSLRDDPDSTGLFPRSLQALYDSFGPLTAVVEKRVPVEVSA